MKTCQNCKHLERDDWNDQVDSPRWKCSHYQEEGENKAVEITDQGSELIDEEVNCVNWTKKKRDKELSEKNVSENCPVDAESATEPSEHTPEKLNSAKDRLLERIRKTNHEVRELEDERSIHAGAARRLAKSVSEKRLELDRLTNLNADSFLDLEEEERKANALPLIEAAERKANEWKRFPVDKLDLPEKDIEKLLKHFELCGEVADWLCRDYPEKKEGCNGKAFRDRVVDAINKISGAEELLKQQVAADDADEPPKGLQEAIDEFNNMRQP